MREVLPGAVAAGRVFQQRLETLCQDHAAAATAAERERIAKMAEKVDATYDAPCPDGVGDCIHQDLPFADLIREEAT